jgi:hypothetical protein
VPVAEYQDSELIRAALATFGDYARMCPASLKIRNKSAISVPLHLSPSQLKLTRRVQEIRRRNKPVRIVILKPRQVHFSVGCAAVIFREVAFLPGQQAMCIADLYKTAENLFSYYKQFQDSYQPYAGIAQLNPLKSHKGQRVNWEGDSYVQFGSAESLTTGRSYSLRHLHLSEYAFYGDAAALMTGLMQSVPDDSGTTVIVESTANGIGGPFYDLWQRANDPQEKGEWEPLFFAWFEHPEYTRQLDMPRDTFQRSLDDEERFLHQRFLVQFEQLNWRRWAIKNKCENSVDRFHQEYPATPEEAFLVSGRPVFDSKALARMPIDREPFRGRLAVTDTYPEKQIILERADNGELEVFRRPERGRAYAIGIDTARGIDVGGGAKSDPDYSVAQVIDIDSGEQVASMALRISPLQWASMLAVLGKWYNHAWLVPEANENGLSVIERLCQIYPVTMIYRRKPTPDRRDSPKLDELGWWTDTRSRPHLVATLEGALREGSVIVRKARTLQECRTFVYKENGRTEHQDGCHDDEVISLGLAVIGMTTAPRNEVRVGAHRLPNTPTAFRYGRNGFRPVGLDEDD